MVLKPGLYNNHNPNTFNTYISSRTGNQPSSAHIRATMFSPEETPIFRTEPLTCAVILSFEANTHQTCRSPTALLRGYILTHGNTHQHTLWLPQGFGSLPNGKPPTRRLHLPCLFGPYNIEFPARAGIPFLVGGSNPLFGLYLSMCEPCRDRLTTPAISVKDLSHRFLCVRYTTYSSELHYLHFSQ